MSKRDKQGKFVQRSLSQQAWIQFRSNRLAICGLVVIALLILVGQIGIVTVGGKMFSVTPLSSIDWLLIIGGTSIVLWVGEAMRLVSKK